MNPTTEQSEPDEQGEPALAQHRHVLRHWLHTREKIRANKGVHHTYRAVVFAVGLFFIAIGIALSPLPGPLTIPPILLGVYIWSTEFGWAHRWLERFKTKALVAWHHAKAHPVADGVFTVLGMLIAAVVIWAFIHFGVMAVITKWAAHWWHS